MEGSSKEFTFDQLKEWFGCSEVRAAEILDVLEGNKLLTSKWVTCKWSDGVVVKTVLERMHKVSE